MSSSHKENYRSNVFLFKKKKEKKKIKISSIFEKKYTKKVYYVKDSIKKRSCKALSPLWFLNGGNHLKKKIFSSKKSELQENFLKQKREKVVSSLLSLCHLDECVEIES